MILENKKIYKSYIEKFSYPNATNYENAVRDFFSQDASINVVEPINEIKGAEKLLKIIGWAFQQIIN